MARLPDISTEARPLPRPSTDIAQLQSGTGMEMTPAEQMAATGSMLMKAGEEIQQSVDQTRVIDEFANNFSPKFRELYKAYYAKQGKDAVDAFPQFSEAMQK